MNKTIDVQHVEIVFSVPVGQSRPTVLSSDFLKAEGVVPADWEVAQFPTYTKGTAEDVSRTEIPFQNGICITYQSYGIAFLEDLRDKKPENSEISQVADRYIRKFPQEDYGTVSINLEGHAVFDTQDEMQSYLAEHLLNPNNRHETDQNIPYISFHFSYCLGRCLLMLNIRSISKQDVVRLEFSAHFYYHHLFHRLSGLAKDEELRVLSQTINNWQTDLDTYREIVNKRFLSQKG